MKNYNYSKGVSLIEALFVLGIMAILIGMVMVLLSSASDRFKTNSLKEELMEIVHIASDLSKGRADYWGSITAPDIINSGQLGHQYYSNGLITTPYGTVINFATVNASSTTTNDIINLWVSGLSQADCISIATTDFSNLSNAMNINYNVDSGGKAFNPQIATQFCLKSGNNVIGWNFYRQE